MEGVQALCVYISDLVNEAFVCNGRSSSTPDTRLLDRAHCLLSSKLRPAENTLPAKAGESPGRHLPTALDPGTSTSAKVGKD